MTQAAIKPVQVGDIFTYTWGYDQTNVEFYQVVRVSEKSVWVQEIHCKHVKATGWASDQVVPDPGNFKNEPVLTKRIQTSDWRNEPCITFRMNHGYAWPWDGRPEHRSWYA